MIVLFRQIWADPVWSKVIAGVILGAPAVLAAYNWWTEFVAAVARTARFLLATTPVWNWLIVIFCLCAVVVVGIFALVVYAWIRPDVAPSWRTYRADEFLGMKWRWRYDDNNQIRDLLPFCPHCDFQIVPHDASDSPVSIRTEFRCDDCETHVCTLNSSLPVIEDRVARQIQKKMRSGEWRNPSTLHGV